MDDVQLIKTLTEMHGQIQANTDKIVQLEGITQAVSELATTMKLMANKQQQLAENVDKMDEAISDIQQKSGKRWDSIVDKVLLLIISTIVAYILAQIGIS